MLFFKILCFVWAAVGIGSRIAMLAMKDKWNAWEINSAYSEKRPAWVIAVAIIGLTLIGITWAVYLINDIAYGWILSVFVTLTFIKIVALIFNYDKFREFAKNMLGNKGKMMILNIAVIKICVILILLGIFLY